MKVITMVGVPGAGKSTIAMDIKIKQGYDNVKVFSSDEYRKALPKEASHAEVFDKLFKDFYTELEQDVYDVLVLDATNLSRRRRRVIYKEVKRRRPESKVEVIVALKTLAELIATNELRPVETAVPTDVVVDKYNKLQVPRVGADCDSIKAAGEFWFKWDFNIFEAETVEDVIAGMNDRLKDEVGSIVGMEHDCPPHHMETIDEHIDMCAAHDVCKSFPVARAVALFHDLGKAITKKVDKNGRATYRGHANVSSMYFLGYMLGTSPGDEDMEEFTQKHEHVLETIFQHMNAHQKLGLKNIRNNKLENIKMFIDLFATIDSESRITAPVESEGEPVGLHS